MRFLNVAERELRVAARRKGTYVIRWVTAAAFLLLLVWLMWATDALKYQGHARQVFAVFAVLIFFYCLIIGAVRTADCLSSERREGTLGLLFLTNLNSFEIIAGKLASNALPTVYGLLSIIPLLALPMLMGGITFDHFWRAVLALLDAIFFSLAAGFVASVFCKRQFTAVALAMALAIVFGAGLFGVAAIISQLRGPVSLVDGLSAFCPLYALSAADGGRTFGRNHYWLALACTAGMSVTWLGLVTWQLSRSWRDRPKSVRAKGSSNLGQSTPQRGQAGRTALRRRLLGINPFYWLAGRRQVSSPVFMCLMIALVLITDYATAPYFARIIPGGRGLNPMFGSLIAWVCTGVAIHVLVLYYAAMISSQRLAEDKEAGALELILSTPVTERAISRGLWLAFARRMLFPALVALLVHAFFLWQCMVMATLAPPGQFPANSVTSWEIFRAALLDEPMRGHTLEWGFIFMIRIALLIPAMLIVVWFTLGWVARWLGLKMKHPGFAPMVTLALVFVPPILIFSLLCYVVEEWHVLRMPERQKLPLMMWLAVAIGLTHCLWLCTWAAQNLRRNFRQAVIGRFESSRRRWLPEGRTVLHFALRAAVFAGALALAAVAFYVFQGYRSRHAWAAFQAELRQHGQSLEVAAVLPARVPDAVNFARAPAFQDIVSQKNRPARALVDSLQFLDAVYGIPGQSQNQFGWREQGPAPLGKFARWLDSAAVPDENIENKVAAPILLKLLQRHDESLRALAAAAQLPSFQVTTNRDALAVLQPRRDELQTMERLQFLFTLRASARLETGLAADAETDVLTSLRLARLGRQSPDWKSSTHEQFMLARSLQPLWDGLARREWTEPQLAAIQGELERFELLADFTNAVHRLVLANISLWKDIPGSRNPDISLPAVNGGFNRNSDWEGQPRAWWFYNCIQLYRLGQTVIAQVDVPGERVWGNPGWSDLSSLPLDSEAQQFLGQYQWQGVTLGVVAYAQTSLNQARLACALERYRLANGSYPAQLDRLVPTWLSRIPNDVARGQPLVYEPILEGRYRLRAFGPNHVNDRTNSVSDDWLWAYQTNAPASTQ